MKFFGNISTCFSFARVLAIALRFHSNRVAINLSVLVIGFFLDFTTCRASDSSSLSHAPRKNSAAGTENGENQDHTAEDSTARRTSEFTLSRLLSGVTSVAFVARNTPGLTSSTEKFRMTLLTFEIRSQSAVVVCPSFYVII